jgi:5-methylcytosine-specific restriction endonuclease McrA
LRRLQDLLRHSVRRGDLDVIVERALTLLLEHVQRTKIGVAGNRRRVAAAPNTKRHIPAAVKRTVWMRDEGRCAFVGSSGRCRETGFLEFHHVTPFAHGGPSTAENLELRCRAHNVFEEERRFHDLPRTSEAH